MLRDRRDAGRLLARELRRYANRPDVVVLGLPRGGVPVAHEARFVLLGEMPAEELPETYPWGV